MLSVEDQLSKSWWLLLVQGVLAIIFGIIALSWPGITLFSFILVFGAYALVDGVSRVFDSLWHRDNYKHWWLVLLWGLISIAGGVLVFSWPGLSAVLLLLIIGARALAGGILQTINAVRFRKAVNGAWLMMLAGIASIVFGVIVFAWPGATALAIIWVIGIHAIIFGVIEVVRSFMVKGMGQSLEPQPAT